MSKTRKFSYLAVLLLLVGAVLITQGAGCVPPGNQPGNNNQENSQNQQEDLILILRQLFAQKYSKDVADISVTITQQDTNHAMGSVRLSAEPGDAGMYWAAKINNAWTIVEDGNGTPSCTLLRQYDFPDSMLSYCADVPPAQQENLTDILKNLFSQKYNLPVAGITVNISQQDATHVMGSVRLSAEPGNAGMFWAAKANNSWTIVEDGNGTPSCTLLNQYNFPASMTSYCADVPPNTKQNGTATGTQASQDDNEAGLKVTFCTAEQKKATVCTMIYKPVCGWFDSSVKCIKYPCAQDFGSSCSACMTPNVDRWTEGKCPTVAAK